MRFCIILTAWFDRRNAYTGSKTVAVTTMRHTAYRMRKGWLELLRIWIACSGRKIFHRKSNWPIIPHIAVIKVNKLKKATLLSTCHRFGVRNPSKTIIRKSTTLSVKAKIIA